MTKESSEEPCEGCEGMAYVVSHVFGWAARDLDRLDGGDTPAEGTVCLERCGACEALDYDEDAHQLARRDGVQFDPDWPWIVSAKGVAAYNGLRRRCSPVTKPTTTRVQEP